jgi:hypothetical protein
MGKYASGKRAYFISDRSGFRYDYKDMRKEWNGAIVGPDEFEPKHPQLGPFRKVDDPQALRDARPDNDEGIIPFVVYTNFGLGIIGKKLDTFESLGSVGTVTVSTTETASSTFDSTSVTLDSATKTFDEG